MPRSKEKGKCDLKIAFALQSRKRFLRSKTGKWEYEIAPPKSFQTLNRGNAIFGTVICRICFSDRDIFWNIFGVFSALGHNNTALHSISRMKGGA